MMNAVEAHIQEWIKKVSVTHSELGDISICSFAASANTKIVECNVEDIIPVEGYDVVFYVVEDYLDLQSVQFWVSYYNKLYTDYIFLEDHATYDSYIKGIQTNNGKYNLILMQDRKKLLKHREILRETGYYSHWNAEMLKEILGQGI
jgi:hypothetical protein